jgi:fatty-acyl-CoA synthase
VVGIPDERWGEVPEAFVVLRSDASVSDAELRDFARESLAHFKVPHRFTFVDELPKTATGKIQKYMLRRGRPGISAV